MSEGKWKDLLINKGRQINQPPQIILILDLITFNFNGILTMNFLKFNSMVSDDSKSIKLGLMQDHGMTIMCEGLH